MPVSMFSPTDMWPKKRRVFAARVKSSPVTVDVARLTGGMTNLFASTGQNSAAAPEVPSTASTNQTQPRFFIFPPR